MKGRHGRVWPRRRGVWRKVVQVVPHRFRSSKTGRPTPDRKVPESWEERDGSVSDDVDR